MVHEGGSLDAWERSLSELERDLAEREAMVLSSRPDPQELQALAAERDKLADSWNGLADARDRMAAGRDDDSEVRDVRASQRDRRARGRRDDNDEGFPDRFLSGRDVDAAAGDRVAARGDRTHGAADRARAATARERAANDRQRAVDEAAQLRHAVEGRTLIGQAQGIYMERYGLDAEGAFRLLVRLSQSSNVKLRAVAQLVTEGHSPESKTKGR